MRTGTTVLAAVLVLAMASAASATLQVYTDRDSWQAAVTSLGLEIQVENFDGEGSGFVGQDFGVARGPGSLPVADDPWQLGGYHGGTLNDYIDTGVVRVGIEQHKYGWTLAAGSTTGPCSGNYWGVYDSGSRMRIEALDVTRTITNTAAIGLDISHSYYANTGNVSIATTNQGTLSWVIPADTYHFVGWVEDSGSLVITKMNFQSGYYDGYNADNFSFAYRSSATAPHMTATPHSGSLLDFGHLTAAGAASTVTTVNLASDGPAGTTVNITGAAFGAGTLFGFDSTPGAVPVAVAQGTNVNYGIKFLGSTTPGTYTDTVSFVTDAGTFTYNLQAIVDVPGPHMGDANGDKKVDLQDFSLLKSHYNETGTPPWGSGNFNGDSKVDLQDFSLLKSHYNHTGDEFTTPVTAVPEPCLVTLLAAGGLALLRRRRR